MVKASVYAQKWLMSEVGGNRTYHKSRELRSSAVIESWQQCLTSFVSVDLVALAQGEQLVFPHEAGFLRLISPMAAVPGTTFFVTRNLSINPDVRLNKDDRVAGVSENYEEGRLYRDHDFRKYLALQHKTIMPTFNEFLTAALPKNTPTDPVDNQDNPHNQPVQSSCP